MTKTRALSRGSRERGVTLIELLIAVSLVGLLSVGMLFAMRTGLGALTATNARLNGNRRVLSVERILDAQISGVMPVTANCGANALAAPGGGGNRAMFFQGTPETMRFVSNYSLDGAARGYPRIVEMQVIPGEKSGVRLVVNEYPYTGPDGAGAFCIGGGPTGTTFLPVQVGPASFVLADRLAFCRFSFRELAPDRRSAVWVPIWGNRELLPSGVRVDMTPLEVDPARVPLESMTIAIRLTRHVLAKYPDELPR
ncbi:MAG: prepilin-type N-terminal cleavage/methylation domain-containing protein [Bryobacteraceae bacterium]